MIHFPALSRPRRSIITNCQSAPHSVKNGWKFPLVTGAVRIVQYVGGAFGFDESL